MTIGIRAARLALLASLLAPTLLAACRGRGGPHSFAIDGLAPDTFVGGVTHPFTIHVPRMPSEAKAPGAEIIVTFTASAGTPFDGGKSATAEVPAIATGPETISSSSPIPVESFDATVSVRTAHRTSRLPDLLAHFVEHAPVASDDFYDVIGNVPLVVGASAGVLFNDTDEDGDVLTAISADAVSAQGGHVTMALDGGFRYVPPVGFRGDDSFQYTCGDGAVAASATVHLTVAAGAGGMVWFIDAAAAPGGDGTIDAPFDSIAAFMAKQGGGALADPAAGEIGRAHV